MQGMARGVMVDAPDGSRIRGTYHPPTSAEAVALLPQLNGNRTTHGPRMMRWSRGELGLYGTDQNGESLFYDEAVLRSVEWFLAVA